MIKVSRRLMQRYWRMTRALTMGAQALVRDAEGRILLVRHGYNPGWHFPGGGVEFCETAEATVVRELEEETGVVAEVRPRLFAIYGHFDAFPGDHIALFVVDRWSRPRIPSATLEIAEHGFFARDALPDGITPGTRRRIVEICDGVAPSQHW